MKSSWESFNVRVEMERIKHVDETWKKNNRNNTNHKEISKLFSKKQTANQSYG